MRKKKVGLALGGGAARGLAHLGVLEVLEEEGIPIDIIAGTSAGAAIGALYAQGKSADQIKSLVNELNWKKLATLVDLALPRSGFISGRRIKNLIASIIGDVRFEDLKIPFACVATDIETGEEVVINQGSVLEGIRASISIPVAFTVARWGGRYLVDGGLVNPVPVSVLKGMGADFTVAVNVTPDISERAYAEARKLRKEAKEPSLISVMIQSLYIATHSITRSSLEGADIVIEPKIAHISPGDFHLAQECILLGRKAAEEAVPAIKRKLGGN